MKINGKVVGYSVLIITWILAVLFFSRSCMEQKRLDQELVVRVEQAKKDAAEAEERRKEEEQREALLEEQKKERIVLVKTLPVFESEDISVNQTAEPKTKLLNGEKVLLMEEGSPYSLVQIKEKNISGYVWSDCIGRMPESGVLPSRVVVIDAGGQQDADLEKEPVRPESDVMTERMREGAVGRFTGGKEYEITLAVALELEQELEKYGVLVVQTRRKMEVSISNAERGSLASQIEADAFLQMYINRSENLERRGAYVNYAAKEGDDKSKELAGFVLTAYTDAVDAIQKNSVDISEKDTALNWCKVPAVTLKLGYLSNEEEDRCMNQAEMQKVMAEGIAKGLLTYLNVEEQDGE